MANPQIIVEYVARTKSLEQASAKVGGASAKAGAVARKGLVPAGIALAAVAAYSKKATDAASGLNEQIAASNIVFGEHAKGMQAWAQTGAEAFGLSARESLAAANAYGNMFSTVGLGAKDTANMSKSMVQLAGDMASFHDQDPTDMLDALRSGLSGEAEPLKKFGVLMNESTVAQAAYRNGIAKVGSKLTEGQKVQARYALIMEQTKKAQGDFGRTADSVANQQRTLAAQNENTAATFGQALLPAVQAFQAVASKVFGFLGKYPGLMQAVVVAVVALSVAIFALNIALSITAATSLTLLPVIGILAGIVVGIAALIAIGYLLVRNWDTIKASAAKVWAAIKKAAQAVIRWLKANWPLILGILGGPFVLAIILIARNWKKIIEGAKAAYERVKTILGNLRTWLAALPGKIGDIMSRAASRLKEAIVNAAQALFQGVKDKLNAMLEWLRDLPSKVGAVATTIASKLKAPLNAVIGAWNALGIPRVSIPGKKLPGPIPDIPSIGFGPFPFPDIPKLALGGIVTRPTLIMAGEAGPEAVMPLSRAVGPTINMGGVVIREEIDVDRLVAKLSAAVAVRR